MIQKSVSLKHEPASYRCAPFSECRIDVIGFRNNSFYWFSAMVVTGKDHASNSRETNFGIHRGTLRVRVVGIWQVLTSVAQGLARSSFVVYLQFKIDIWSTGGDIVGLIQSTNVGQTAGSCAAD